MPTVVMPWWVERFWLLVWLFCRTYPSTDTWWPEQIASDSHWHLPNQAFSFYSFFFFCVNNLVFHWIRDSLFHSENFWVYIAGLKGMRTKITENLILTGDVTWNQFPDSATMLMSVGCCQNATAEGYRTVWMEFRTMPSTLKVWHTFGNSWGDWPQEQMFQLCISWTMRSRRAAEILPGNGHIANTVLCAVSKCVPNCPFAWSPCSASLAIENVITLRH